jgi:hypothetical protein
VNVLGDIDDALDEVEEEVSDQSAARARHRNRRTIADLRSELRELNREIDSLEELVATLEALKPKPPKPKALKVPPRRKKSAKRPGAFVALASDWHTCEVVTAAQSGGNVHDQAIGEERAWKWARSLVSLVKREQASTDLQSVVAWLGGDFLVNDGLHMKSERACHLSPPDEAQFIRDLLAQILTYLRAELDVPLVVPTSWGNHDRSTPKMVAGHAGDYSHMQPVYRDLASWFASDDSVQFYVAQAEFLPLDLHGYKLLFHHGHAIRYGGGVGGLAVPFLRAAGRLRSDYDFRTLCIGHHHQRNVFQGGLGIANGSLVGPNGYSRDMGLPSEPPAQVAFAVDLERFEVANTYTIWGDE